MPDRPTGEQRRKRRRHRDAGARAVLRNSARGYVDVERAVLEDIVVEPVVGRPRTHRREGDLCGLLHHVAELAGEYELLAARDARRLDEQDVSTDAGDRKAGGDAWNCRALRRLAEEALPSERVPDDVE